MENLEIISTQVTVQAKKLINGNTANFNWNRKEGEIPSAINFNVMRGVSGEPNYNGNNVISGQFYPQLSKLDIQNHNFQEGDLDIYAEVIAVCQALVLEIENENIV